VLVVDQTPTPTKFLISCEEVGLFQEINPFDKDFKKAVEQQQSEVCLRFIDVTVEVVFLSFFTRWHMPSSRTSAEACLTGWPNARPQEWDKCSVA